MMALNYNMGQLVHDRRSVEWVMNLQGVRIEREVEDEGKGLVMPRVEDVSAEERV
jgi:uncharacterized membrane-anchored protein